jgi:hypothetical protein
MTPSGATSIATALADPLLPEAGRRLLLERMRNEAGWIACPRCGQPLVEKVEGVLCSGCPALWSGTWP